jgi:hypothetical protein
MIQFNVLNPQTKPASTVDVQFQLDSAGDLNLLLNGVAVLYVDAQTGKFHPYWIIAEDRRALEGAGVAIEDNRIVVD